MKTKRQIIDVLKALLNLFIVLLAFGCLVIYLFERFGVYRGTLKEVDNVLIPASLITLVGIIIFIPPILLKLKRKDPNYPFLFSSVYSKFFAVPKDKLPDFESLKLPKEFSNFYQTKNAWSLEYLAEPYAENFDQKLRPYEKDRLKKRLIQYEPVNYALPDQQIFVRISCRVAAPIRFFDVTFENKNALTKLAKSLGIDIFELSVDDTGSPEINRN